MKLFTNEQIRAIERQTVESEGISPGEVIERVAEGVADEICRRWHASKPTIVFAGYGNNGADALATARRLCEHGFNPEIYLFNIGGDKLSMECLAARDRLLAEVPGVNFHEVTSRFYPPDITTKHLVVDGLFGAGLCDELQGGFLSLVQHINEEHPTVVSIDLPSGMFGDWNPRIINRNCIHATLTLAIQFPRLAFFIPGNAELVGEWKVLEVGLSQEAMNREPAEFCIVEKRDIQRRLRHRKEFCSKNDFGTGMLYAGSYGMVGAAVLAAKGSLRGGIGKLTVCSPRTAFPILQTAVPEALYRANRGEQFITEMHPERDFSAIAVGPGMGTNELTVKALEDFVASIGKPLILDADALNCIAIRPAILNSLPMFSILTPHAGEFDRIFGPQPSAEARLRKAVEMAKAYGIFIILKGHYTAIVRPDRKIYFNSSGCTGMATAGSGDVLTGLLLAMLAQGYPPEIASIIAVYIHGVAGEYAQAAQGEYGVTAGDIAANIGVAIRDTMK